MITKWKNIQTKQIFPKFTRHENLFFDNCVEGGSGTPTRIPLPLTEPPWGPIIHIPAFVRHVTIMLGITM